MSQSQRSLGLSIGAHRASGDSLSAVGAPNKPMPTLDEPLGIEFPGITYNEPDLPNWVGFMASDHHPMLVYNYARGGHTCKPGLSSQVNSMYLPHAGTKPDYAQWLDRDSMFGESSRAAVVIHRVHRPRSSYVDRHQRLRVRASESNYGAPFFSGLL